MFVLDRLNLGSLIIGKGSVTFPLNEGVHKLVIAKHVSWCIFSLCFSKINYFLLWFLLIQCGQGNTDDLLRPTLVSSLSETKVDRVAAGLWHTLCISVEGQMYAFGGNQFGQLGTGVNSYEVCYKSY